MKKALISNLVSVLLTMLTPTALKNIVDGVLDMIEDAVAASESEIDDAIIGPLIKTIRAAFDIPDNDEEKPAS